MMIEPLRLVLPFGGYNAGAIVEPDLSVVEQKLIPPDAAREAVAMFQQHGIDCWVFVGNEWLIANPNGDHVDREIHTIQTRAMRHVLTRMSLSDRRQLLKGLEALVGAAALASGENGA